MTTATQTCPRDSGVHDVPGEVVQRIKRKGPKKGYIGRHRADDDTSSTVEAADVEEATR